MSIVLCSGCFDPLHIGHLWHLKQARKMGRLVVAVTLASNVNKGRGRPIFRDKERVEMLDALYIVDKVILVHSSLEALKVVRPDIFCKGAEYRGHIRKDDADYCKASCIKIKFTSGKTYSSTALINGLGQG